jgi:serine phosphatase RsbU (regulator of sigma subunit)
MLVVYSDGLTDAENHAQESFGEARLMGVIRENATCAGVREGILKALEEFTGGAPQNDDITFLVVRRIR